MDLTLRAAESILVMMALFGAALALRSAKVLTEQHAGVFAKAITQLVLPALVFGHLAAHRIRWEMLDAPALMFSSGVLLMLLGYVVGRWVFRLERPSLGAVVLCTGFTSAAFLGIALVEIVYPHDGNMEETVLIAELGVGVPVFVLGPLIAAYFGVRGDGEAFSIVRGLLQYLRSPIFIAIVAGLLWGGLALPTGGNLPLDVLFGVCRQLEGGLVPLVGLAVGLMLRPMPFVKLAPLIAFVAVAQLILQPGYLAYSSDLFALLPAQRESLLLQGAAPVATLPAIFCREYNCDAQLAASLILATTLLAMGTIPLAVSWFG
jgi:predicted permease